jgi:hypothetical protein
MATESDDYPILIVYVTDPGRDRSGMFDIYRQLLGVSPAIAKALLSEPRVELARGPRMEIRNSVQMLESAGATVQIVISEGGESLQNNGSSTN